MNTKITIHPIETLPDEAELEPLKAVITSDGRGLLLGEDAEIHEIAEVLERALSADTSAESAEWALARFASDVADLETLWRLFPQEHPDMHLLLSPAEAECLVATLQNYLDTGALGPEISRHDRRLGFRWISVSDAAEDYGILDRTIRAAIKRGDIGETAWDGREWSFPEVRFRWWARNPSARRRGRRSKAESAVKTALSALQLRDTVYPDELPAELIPFYCYPVVDAGHSILVVPETFADEDDPGSYLMPVPVKSVLRGYEMRDGWPVVAVDVDPVLGLVVDESDEEF